MVLLGRDVAVIYGVYIIMGKAMDQAAFDKIMKMDGKARYHYFLDEAVAAKKVWAVCAEEGWLVLLTPEGEEYFPLWPHKEHAQKVADKYYPDHRAVEIGLDELLDNWMPLFINDNVLAGIFPDMDWSLWVIESVDLQEDLEEELEKLEQ